MPDPPRRGTPPGWVSEFHWFGDRRYRCVQTGQGGYPLTTAFHANTLHGCVAAEMIRRPDPYRAVCSDGTTQRALFPHLLPGPFDRTRAQPAVHPPRFPIPARPGEDAWSAPGVGTGGHSADRAGRTGISRRPIEGRVGGQEKGRWAPPGQHEDQTETGGAAHHGQHHGYRRSRCAFAGAPGPVRRRIDGVPTSRSGSRRRE